MMACTWPSQPLPEAAEKYQNICEPHWSLTIGDVSSLNDLYWFAFPAPFWRFGDCVFFRYVLAITGWLFVAVYVFFCLCQKKTAAEAWTVNFVLTSHRVGKGLFSSLKMDLRDIQCSAQSKLRKDTKIEPFKLATRVIHALLSILELYVV